MRMWLCAVLLAAVASWPGVQSAGLEIPCAEFHPQLSLPCKCGLNEVNATRINCDSAVFLDFPVLPRRFYIQEFSQRDAGLQTLGPQLFTAADIPLKKVDFSRNSLRRIAERIFEGVEDTLTDVSFGHNLLGDGFNVEFSTDEFRDLASLRHLDLSYNMLRGVAEGILEGCAELKDLQFNGNRLTKVPTLALAGPESLQNLQLQDNLIENLEPLVFKTQPKLLSVNLTNNLIQSIQKGAFLNMTRLVRLILTKNKIFNLQEEVLTDVPNLVELDLSHNFLREVPVDALSGLKNLKFLNLGSNRIESIKEVQLSKLESLDFLDLSRNLIVELSPGTFAGMSNLKGLDFSVNVVRKVEDDAFEGLKNLEYLDISDNKVLSLPAAALGRLPSLKRLKADYNRIGALSYEILRSVTGLEELSLAYNIIREIPKGTFKDLNGLKILNLYGNQIASVGQDTFSGTEENLGYLDLGYNIITSVESINFPSLKYLNLERNFLKSVDGSFGKLRNLNVLNLHKNLIDSVTNATFAGMDNLISVDVSYNLLRSLGAGVFFDTFLNEFNASGNLLKELEESTFVSLPILETLDLSHNNIVIVKNGAFKDIPRLKTLKLDHNRLSNYNGEFFANMGNDTDLHTLDLSHNDLNYLYDGSFDYLPNLKSLDFSHNKFGFFPTDSVRGLGQLEALDLSHNMIKAVTEAQFANFPLLRSLDLSHNDVDMVSEDAFQNSTQLQEVDLSHNAIAEVKTDTFSGTVRLNLDLSSNLLDTLPDGIFERRRVFKLESIDLSNNRFRSIPVNVLQGQYFFIDSLKIANNSVREIPSDANILVNIKEIDVSFNPLSKDSVVNMLNEPKTVHKLNMAGTGIKVVPSLETPFLTHLNLSHNDISVLNEDILSKSSLISLDVSHNQIPNLSSGLSSSWPKLQNLKYLDIGNNPIVYVINGDFKYLDGLQVLKMSHLPKCYKVDKLAFSNLKELKHLEMTDLPALRSLDVRGILKNFNTLETVMTDFKESLIGDHLSPAYSPRLRKLGIKGSNVKNIAIGAFAGISSKFVDISLEDTNINNIPTAIFFPVPMSSHINLNVKGSRLSSLHLQLINALDSKQRHIKLEGLSTNPIFCDCNAKALRRWLLDKNNQNSLYSDLGRVRCAAPDVLAGKLLSELPEAELTCEGRTTTTTTELEFLTERVTPSPEPDIITGSDLELRTSSSTQSPLPSRPSGKAEPNKMDALIIGIVGGVVAFIAIIIICICIVRLRLTDSQYRGGPLAGPLALRAQGKCTCLKPVPPTLYGAPGSLPPPSNGYLSYPSTPVPPPHHTLALTWAGNAAGTVNSQKMLPPPQSGNGSVVNGQANGFGTVGAHSYLSAVSRGSHHPALSYPVGAMTPGYGPPPGTTPYYVTFPADSDGEAGGPQSPHSGRDSGRR